MAADDSPRPKPAWFEARTPPSCPASFDVEAHIYLVQTLGKNQINTSEPKTNKVNFCFLSFELSFELRFLAFFKSRSVEMIKTNGTIVSLR